MGTVGVEGVGVIVVDEVPDDKAPDDLLAPPLLPLPPFPWHPPGFSTEAPPTSGSDSRAEQLLFLDLHGKQIPDKDTAAPFPRPPFPLPFFLYEFLPLSL